MLPRTTELLTALAQSHAALGAAFDAVPVALRERSPAADRWSPAQVIEHLAHTAAGVAALLKRRLRQLERSGLRPATEPSMGLLPIDAERLRDRTHRVLAPPNVQPNNGLTGTQAWQALDDSRQLIADTLRAADGIDVSEIRAPHPVLGELGFHQWIAFVALHEQRHAAQLREFVPPA